MKTTVIQTARRRFHLMQLSRSFSISEKQVHFVRQVKSFLLWDFLPTIAILLVLGWAALVAGNFILEARSAQQEVSAVNP